MHWADVEAGALLQRSKSHFIATGITPSGPIHIGNIRELITAHCLKRAVEDRGGEATVLYFADDFDPLRKLYPFLDNDFQERIGTPLYQLPCPCGEHEDYASHFLEPFFKTLENLGIEYEVVYTHKLYEEGRMADIIDVSITHRDMLRQILTEVSGRDMGSDWWPYNPKCSKCGKIGKAVPTSYSRPVVKYKCKCGHEGEADINKDHGKLAWRVEWPARWHVLGVTCEPFGKDHAAAGGSYETGSRIIEEVFKGQPPYPLIYEWIHLKGRGAMSSSKGIAITGTEMLGMVAPHVTRFMVVKQQPPKHIDFEPGMGILSLYDEYDKYERVYYDQDDAPLDDIDDWKRIYELSQTSAPRESMPVQVPYKHLVNLVQMHVDWPGIKKVLLRTGEIKELNAWQEELLEARSIRVRYWLDNFAPDMVKFSLQPSPPTMGLTQEERHALETVVKHLDKSQWTGEGIHDAIYAAIEETGHKPKAIFKIFYQMLFHMNRGPRLGYFLSNLEREEVMDRLKLVLAG